MVFKKIALIALGMLACAGAVSASYEDFLRSLQAVQINASAIETAPTISRNSLAELLNYVDCHDCHRPGNELVSRLSVSRWNLFRSSPAVNFDDISYNTSLASTNNYYCVAYTAEQGYMSGYPRQTSPLCSGKFCGTNNTTVADFLQVLINILADRIVSHYQVNWQRVEQWMQDTSRTDLVQRYFSLPDQGLVRRNAQSCTTDSCSLNTAAEFHVYLKYCTFNLDECGMQERNTAKQYFWPVAELNVLVTEGVISASEADAINVNEYVDGETVLRSLSLVKEKVACVFRDDQDYDKIKDYDDNCYITYNPSQTDMDGDGVGDVCDDDIDGDTIKNPVGIVDEHGNLNTHALDTFTDTLDNCIFNVNTDQADFDNDKVGNACSLSPYFGMSIVTRKTNNGTYALAANYTGALTDFSWDFGDGTYGQGRAVSHTFPGQGIYSVVLTAKGGSRTYIATTTISIAINTKPTFGFQITPSPLVARSSQSIAVTPESSRSVGYIDWESNNQTKRGADNEKMSFLYNASGTYSVVAKAYNGNQIVAYAQGSVAVDGSIGAYLKVSSLIPVEGSRVTFSTVTAGINLRDIASVRWDFGDDTTETNALLTHSHIYMKQGAKIVKQTIYLLDGTTLQNIINVDVQAAQASADQGVDILPEKLVMQTNDLVRYRFVLNGLTQADIGRIIVDMGDYQTLVFTGGLSNGFTYRYLNPGIYRVMSRVQKTDGLRFYPAAHITVTGKPLCLQTNNATKSGACDMDNDGVADICDDDINGDGTKNILGLIVNQPQSCIYTPADLDNSMVAESIYLISQGAPLDKCPVSRNPDQTDKNGNFIGDGCEGLIRVDPDSDGDGITDSIDACVYTPENYNGIEDKDGCPDALDVIAAEVEGSIDVQCKVCPCPYIEDAADIKKGDKVRAVLLNNAGTVRINTSSVRTVE